MAHTTDKISKPVAIADIANVLVSSSNNLGELCRESSVNKWAKYKPVKHHTKAPTGKTEVVAGRSDYWQGDDRATNPYIVAGLNVSNGYQYASGLGTQTGTYHGIRRNTTTFKLTFSNESQASTGFLYRLVHGSSTWERATPTGGVDSNGYPYRALDFDGYLHTAECPFPTPPADGTKPAPSGSATIIAEIPDGLPTDNLQLSEITLPSVLSSLPLTGFYLTLVFYKADGTDMFWRSSETAIGTLNDAEQKRKKVSIKVANISGSPSGYNRYGTWKMRCFLSSYPINSDARSGDGYADGLTSGGGIKFVIADPVERQVTFLDTSGAVCNVVITSAHWKGAESNAHISATIENYLGQNMSISRIRCEVLDAFGSRIDSPVDVSAPSTLNAGDSLGITANFPNMFRQVGCTAKVTLTATAGGQAVTTTPAVPTLAFDN